MNEQMFASIIGHCYAACQVAKGQHIRRGVVHMRAQRKHLINITKEKTMDTADLKRNMVVWWVKKKDSKDKNFVAQVEFLSYGGVFTGNRAWVKVIQVRQGYNSHIEVGQPYSPFPSELVENENEIGEVPMTIL